MSNCQKKIGIGVIVAILCAVAFYFLYWIKTPVYSLNIIKESIQKHDTTTFEKHVDMDTLYVKAFDDSIVAMSRIQGDDTLSNPFAAGIIQMLKPTVVSALKQQTIEFVKGEKESSNKQTNEANNMAKGMKDKVAVDKSELKDISVISKDGNESIVSIKIYNKQLTKDFNIKVKMTKLDDGTWKLREISNLVDFLIELDKAEKAKLAELNKPIMEELKNALSSTSTMQLRSDGNPFFASYWLEYDFSIKNSTDKDITKFYSKVSVLGPNGKILKSNNLRYDLGTIKPKSSVKLSYKANLNQFIDNEKLIIDNPADKKLIVEISSIIYANGKEVKILDKLPEVNE